MKIKSIEVKTVVVINGHEYVQNEEDWTESIKDAKECGITFKSNQDIFDWIEIQ